MRKGQILMQSKIGSLLMVISFIRILLNPTAMAVTDDQMVTMLMPQSTSDKAILNQIDNLFQQEKTMLPLVLFLQAEHLREHGKIHEARNLYYKLIKNAGNDQYKDTWGDNGLVAFALFRWLELEESSNSNDKKRFIEISELSDDLLQRRLVRSAFRHRYYILPRLPILEEKILHKLARLAHRMSEMELAAKHYLNYVSRTKHLASLEEDADLYQSIIDKGMASSDRITLMQLSGLSNSGTLRQMLRKVVFNERPDTWENFQKLLPNRLNIPTRYEDSQIQLRIEYLLLRAAGDRFDRRDIGRHYRDIHRYASDEEISSQALYWHSLLFQPTECIIDGEITRECGKAGGIRPYQEGLKKLVDTYDDVSKKDDAYYWLALGEIRNHDLDSATGWYEQLSEFDADSNYVGRIAVRIALEYIWRNRDRDRQKAYKILSAFSKRHPASNWALNALFWMGRLDEERGDTLAARKNFEKCISYDPYGYYGLRSRMHLLDGVAARSQILSTNKKLKQKINKEYRAGIEKIDGDAQDNPYFKRFVHVVNTGLFPMAVKGEENLRQVNPSKRLEEYTPEELESTGYFTRIALMLALRQDALAAADSIESKSARLMIAKQAGEGSDDWPLSLTLSHPSAFKLLTDRSKLTQTRGYIKISHPEVYKDLMGMAKKAYGASPNVLYSVMRNESFFYPAALSRSGALGLFQFTEPTFEKVDSQWSLLRDSNVEDRQAYLLNKKLAFELAARWFSDPESMVHDESPLFMVLSHHSGQHRVSRWKSVWEERGWLSDTEMMIETFRMPGFHRKDWVEDYGYEARKFSRNVTADLIIADLLDIYQDK
jgi:hypothetical protein